MNGDRKIRWYYIKNFKKVLLCITNNNNLNRDIFLLFAGKQALTVHTTRCILKKKIFDR